MGCCSPNERKTVNEHEKKVNEKGNDSLHWGIKATLILVFVAGLIAVVFFN